MCSVKEGFTFYIFMGVFCSALAKDYRRTAFKMLFALLTFHKSGQIRTNLCKFKEERKMATYFPEEYDFSLIHLSSN